jgi:chromate transporter
MNDSLFLRMILVLAPLSFMTIGGGQAIITELHRQAVDVNGWLADGKFLELYALSRLVPGPTPTFVTMIGWQVGGFWTSMVATAAIYLPAILSIFALAGIWQRYRGARWQKAIEQGLTPLAVGMLGATVATLLSAPAVGWIGWVIALATTVALIFTRINPFVMVGLGAVVFAVRQALF